MKMTTLIENRTLVRSTSILVITLFVFSSLLPTVLSSTVIETNDDLSEIHVGIYNSYAAQSASVIAIENLFDWLGSNLVPLDAEAIRNGTLDSLDLLVIPPGSSNGYETELEDSGVECIRQFIANGGSYFALCGGSMFASQVLGLYEGIWSTDIPGMPGGSALVELNVNQACIGPDLSTEPESYQVYFSGSRCFIPYNPGAIIPVMFYPTNDAVAMFVTRYGAGTVFASGVHAEYEEGSDRDGVTAFDYLNDPDSEWDLLQKVIGWLVDEAGSPANVNPLAGFGSIFIVVGVSIVIVMAGLVFFYLRRRTR